MTVDFLGWQDKCLIVSAGIWCVDEAVGFCGGFHQADWLCIGLMMWWQPSEFVCVPFL
ncbi:MAG: hypothetical protein NC252_00415 [Roseburia sp.]|nr:hypothetical protein [Roseburia sp.]MCM1419950.1 hypothetical protein [Bacteroides sp.]